MTGLGSLISAVIIGNMKRRENGQSIRPDTVVFPGAGRCMEYFQLRFFKAADSGRRVCGRAFMGIINVLFITVLQQLTPDSLWKGDGHSVLCSAGLQPVSYMLTGVVLNQFSISQLTLYQGEALFLLQLLYGL